MKSLLVLALVSLSLNSFAQETQTGPSELALEIANTTLAPATDAIRTSLNPLDSVVMSVDENIPAANPNDAKVPCRNEKEDVDVNFTLHAPQDAENPQLIFSLQLLIPDYDAQAAAQAEATKNNTPVKAVPKLSYSTLCLGAPISDSEVRVFCNVLVGLQAGYKTVLTLTKDATASVTSWSITGGETSLPLTCVVPEVPAEEAAPKADTSATPVLKAPLTIP